MDYVLTKIRLKSGKENESKEFLHKLHSEQQSGMKSILDESQIDMDCSFIDQIEGRHYLFIFKKLESISKLRNDLKESRQPLYKDIRKWAEDCFEKLEDLHSIAVFESKNSDR